MIQAIEKLSTRMREHSCVQETRSVKSPTESLLDLHDLLYNVIKITAPDLVESRRMYMHVMTA